MIGETSENERSTKISHLPSKTFDLITRAYRNLINIVDGLICTRERRNAILS